MIVLTCQECHTYQLRVFPDAPGYLQNLDHIHCPVCNHTPSPELVQRLKELAQRHHELMLDWQAGQSLASAERWILGVPISAFGMGRGDG